MAVSLDLWPFRQEVQGPALLLSGDASRTSPVEQPYYLAEQLPDSHLEVYPGLGRGINGTYPEWWVGQIRQFSVRHPL